MSVDLHEISISLPHPSTHSSPTFALPLCMWVGCELCGDVCRESTFRIGGFRSIQNGVEDVSGPPSQFHLIPSSHALSSASSYNHTWPTFSRQFIPRHHHALKLAPSALFFLPSIQTWQSFFFFCCQYSFEWGRRVSSERE